MTRILLILPVVSCYTPNVKINNSNINCLIGKLIFAINLPLKVFSAPVASTENGSLNSLYTLFNTYLEHMLTKFGPNRIVRNVHNLNCLTKTEFLINQF